MKLCQDSELDGHFVRLKLGAVFGSLEQHLAAYRTGGAKQFRRAANFEGEFSNAF